MSESLKKNLTKYKIVIIIQLIIIAVVIFFMAFIMVDIISETRRDDYSTTNSEGRYNSQMVQTFNAQFESYEGEKESGGNVKSLIDAVNSNNDSIVEGASGVYVELIGVEVSGTDNKETDGDENTHPGEYLAEGIRDSRRYNVTITEITEEGLIREMTVNSSN